MARLTLEALRKEYDRGRVIAVGDPSLDAKDGEFIIVAGPSDCGKSTTLHMVAGLESPSDSTIRIGNGDVTGQHARKRDVATVFQNYALHPHKTVMQNMAFGLRVNTDLLKDGRHEHVRETAAMIGIESLLDNKPDELSGEQKQRVALGRAIVHEPDVFLFDKPLSNLNARLHTTTRTEVQRLQNELEITSLYVMHDQGEAMTIGDKIVILDDRKLQQIDRPKGVYESPANEFVDGFVGSPSASFLDVSVKHGDGRLVLAGGSPFSHRLSESFSATLREMTGATDLRVSVHLEDVVTAFSGENVIGSTVGVVEPIGSDNYLHLGIGPDFIARVDSDVEPETDETVNVTFDESDFHVFRPRAGESFLSRESKRRTAST